VEEKEVEVVLVSHVGALLGPQSLRLLLGGADEGGEHA